MYDIVTITVNYKMKDDIDHMLSGLFADIKNTTLKVLPVVVDNGSGDDIGAFLKEKYPSVEFIAAPKNVGFGAANNLALKKFPSRYYFLLNPDIHFSAEENVLERLYTFMEKNPAIGLIGPKLLNVDGTLQHSCYRFPEFFTPPLHRLAMSGRFARAEERIKRFLMKDFHHASTKAVDWVMGSAMFVRGKALTEVGTFDEAYFMYFEDCDWCRRFWKKGWPVYYVHDVSLSHAHRRQSARVAGKPVGLRAIFSNKLTRIHIKSWLTYFWKWRKDRLYKYR